MLIPAYRDMDPYDLPDEFSHLQAQDMSKLGFMQDLIRGIKKIAQADIPKTTVVKETVISGGNANTAPLLKRAFMFLEDGDWNSANEYCEKVLDIDPENAQAYLGKLMAELRVNKQDDLKDQPMPFDQSNNFQKTVRFADEKLKATLSGYIEHIQIRNENTQLENMYTRAKNAMSAANNESAYKKAARLFESIGDYLNSAQLADECHKKSEAERKDAILREAKRNMTFSITKCEGSIALLQLIPGWRDADEQIVACQKKIEEIKAKEAAERLEKERQAEIARKEAERIAKRNKKIAIITTSVICAIIAFVIVLNTVIIPAKKKNDFIATYGQEMWNKIESLNVGDIFSFGLYEQDNNKSNGQEDIEWLVLAKEETRILVISKYALDCKQYNTSDTDVTWETCTLRKWLNNDFLGAAFSADEKAMFPTVTISSYNNTNPGNATQDQVFLLSITEANKYFSSDGARQCKPTDYAVANGALESDNGNCWWWLRSPGISDNNAVFVYFDGDVSGRGSCVNYSEVAVRPALWIDWNAANQ